MRRPGVSTENVRSAPTESMRIESTLPGPVLADGQLLAQAPRGIASGPSDGVGAFSWGLVSQGFSSATNLGLVLIAGRVLGPSGLGTVAIAFVAYTTVLGFQRALITEPLVMLSAPLPHDARVRRGREALTASVIGVVLAAAIVAAAGVAVGGSVGRAFVLVAPWLLPLVIQDFWRSILFRDGRARGAALNDAVWLLAMAGSAPLAWSTGSEWAVVGCWGLGSVAATLLGFVQTAIGPSRARQAAVWWRNELWPLGRWLGANSLSFAITSNATVLVLVGFVGISGVGGLRAVMTVFAPMTLVGAALALPGLPALARARVRSERSAAVLAGRLGLASAALTLAYLGVLSLGGGSIIPRVFGHSFAGFTNLVWPVGVAQLMAALSVGFGLLLKAQCRGTAVFVSSTVSAIAALGLAAAFAATHGLLGAAWGLTGASAVGLIITAALALRPAPAVESDAVRSAQ